MREWFGVILAIALAQGFVLLLGIDQFSPTGTILLVVLTMLVGAAVIGMINRSNRSNKK